MSPDNVIINDSSYSAVQEIASYERDTDMFLFRFVIAVFLIMLVSIVTLVIIAKSKDKAIRRIVKGSSMRYKAIKKLNSEYNIRPVIKMEYTVRHPSLKRYRDFDNEVDSILKNTMKKNYSTFYYLIRDYEGEYERYLEYREKLLDIPGYMKSNAKNIIKSLYFDRLNEAEISLCQDLVSDKPSLWIRIMSVYGHGKKEFKKEYLYTYEDIKNILVKLDNFYYKDDLLSYSLKLHDTDLKEISSEAYAVI